MKDVVMLAAVTAFFALCLGYVRWCDHIIGPDPIDQPDEDLTGGQHARDFDVDEVPA